MTARGHHFVPRFYLRAFSFPRKRGKEFHTHVFDRNGRHFRSNINNLAKQRDFNRVNLDETPIDRLESDLAELEAEISTHIQRVRSSHSIQNADEYEAVISLAGLLAIRHPSRRKMMNDAMARTWWIMLDLATATEERWNSQAKKMRDDGYDVKEADYQSLRESIEKRDFELIADQNYLIFLEFQMLQNVIDLLRKRKWCLHINESRNSFVSSDRPTSLEYMGEIKYTEIYRPGLAVANTVFSFPLSPELFLSGTIEPIPPIRQANEMFVSYANGLTAMSSMRQVYSKKKRFSVFCHDK